MSKKKTKNTAQNQKLKEYQDSIKDIEGASVSIEDEQFTLRYRGRFETGHISTSSDTIKILAKNLTK